MSAQLLGFDVGDGRRVSALLELPDDPVALYVLAHGAGAGMRHPFLEAMSGLLAARGIGTFRYQFPYVEEGRRRPDTRKLLVATVRAAVISAVMAAPGVPMVAGGKSMGGRMTSIAQAEEPLPGVHGLIFLGFPLHRAGAPDLKRATHLARIDVPMLFLQGTRDKLAELPLVEQVVHGLGPVATLELIESGDHSFRVLKRSGRSGEEVLEEAARSIAGWTGRIVRAADSA